MFGGDKTLAWTFAWRPRLCELGGWRGMCISHTCVQGQCMKYMLSRRNTGHVLRYISLGSQRSKGYSFSAWYQRCDNNRAGANNFTRPMFRSQRQARLPNRQGLTGHAYNTTSHLQFQNTHRYTSSHRVTSKLTHLTSNSNKGVRVIHRGVSITVPM